MTKSDIEAVAAAVKAVYADCEPTEEERTEGGDVDAPVLVRVVRGARRRALQCVAVELADRLERQCHSFDSRQFFEACGMASEAKFLSAQMLRGRYSKRLATGSG